MNKRRYCAIALSMAAFAIFSGCTQREIPKNSEPPQSVESIPPSQSETSETENRTLSQLTIEEIREADLETNLQHLKPEMESENVIWYPNNQKVFFRDLLLANGDTRHLTGFLLTDESLNNRLIVTLADSNPSGLVYLPMWQAETSGLDYIRNEENRITVPDVQQIGWLDQKYFYISSPSNIGIFDSNTGKLAAVSQDAWEIYSQVTGLGRSYLQPVNTVYSAGGNAYYTGFRDPELLNINGSLFELSLKGERLLTDDALYIVGVSDSAVVFLRQKQGKDETTPSANGLCLFDLAANEVVELFMDVYYELDSDFMIVGGQDLGNHWAGKQWNYDHPNFTIQDGKLSFYVSRIADGEVDQYVYDLSARTLVNKGVIEQTSKIQN